MAWINMRSSAKGLMTMAAIYQALWGLVAIFAPYTLVDLIFPAGDISPFVLQFLGALSLSLGVGAWFAASEPFRQWSITTVSLLFYCVSSGLYFIGLATGTTSADYMPFVLGNWVLWIIPYILVLFFRYLNVYETDDMLIESFSSEAYSLDLFETNSGQNLVELSEDRKTVLVFLRHFGCPFCKDTMDSIKEVEPLLVERDINLVLVYMVSAREAAPFLEEHGLSHMLQISDPESMLYKKFRLRKGRLGQLFGLKEWKRFAELIVGKGYLLGKETGDSFQMPGVFVMKDGEVVGSFVHQSASQRPDLVSLAESV